MITSREALNEAQKRLNQVKKEYQSKWDGKIEAEGYKAGCSKKSANDNPYNANSWKHDVWELGRSRAN